MFKELEAIEKEVNKIDCKTIYEIHVKLLLQSLIVHCKSIVLQGMEEEQ